MSCLVAPIKYSYSNYHRIEKFQYIKCPYCYSCSLFIYSFSCISKLIPHDTSLHRKYLNTHSIYNCYSLLKFDSIYIGGLEYEQGNGNMESTGFCGCPIGCRNYLCLDVVSILPAISELLSL